MKLHFLQKSALVTPVAFGLQSSQLGLSGCQGNVSDVKAPLDLCVAIAVFVNYVQALLPTLLPTGHNQPSPSFELVYQGLGHLRCAGANMDGIIRASSFPTFLPISLLARRMFRERS